MPADAVRDLVRDAAVRLLVHDDDTGRLLDYGRRTYRAPAPLAATVCATYPTSAGPAATTPAEGCDLDHGDPWDTGGTTAVGNLIPLDRHTHRAKTRGALRYTRDPATGRITWTTALGHTATTHPFDYRLGP